MSTILDQRFRILKTENGFTEDLGEMMGGQVYAFVGTRVSEDSARAVQWELEQKGTARIAYQSNMGDVRLEISRVAPKFELRDPVKKPNDVRIATVQEIREKPDEEPMYWIQYGRDFATRRWADEDELQAATTEEIFNHHGWQSTDKQIWTYPERFPNQKIEVKGNGWVHAEVYIAAPQGWRDRKNGSGNAELEWYLSEIDALGTRQAV